MTLPFNRESVAGNVKLVFTENGKKIESDGLSYETAITAKVAIEKRLDGNETGQKAILYDTSGETPKKIILR